MADDDVMPMEKVVVTENSYQLKPTEEEKFKAGEIRKMMQELLQEKLKGQRYDPTEAAQLSKELCTEIKQKAKSTGCTRHKLVVQVTIGEVQGQGVRISSRCLWDVETDNHASASFQNTSLYCVAMVFAVFFE